MNMGWRIDFTSNKKFLDEDIDDIVENLPEHYTNTHLKDILPHFQAKQPWGWSVICDIQFPHGQSISISGSNAISGDYAQGFAKYFKRALEDKGYYVQQKELQT